MEIERKFLVSDIPSDLTKYTCHLIEQGYLSTKPVVRVRKDNDSYWLTYKESYEHLIKKADGNIITKHRYEIPDGTGKTIELDIFDGLFEGTIFAEVEFDSIEEANSYIPPNWFTKDVTHEKAYHNSHMSQKKFN